jgi:hypothetical protein
MCIQMIFGRIPHEYGIPKRTSNGSAPRTSTKQLDQSKTPMSKLTVKKQPIRETSSLNTNVEPKLEYKRKTTQRNRQLVPATGKENARALRYSSSRSS